jgi:ABC-type glycerol-3-phosphate transport system substrate-binding protein
MSWMAVAASEDEWAVIGFPGKAGETILVDGPGLMIGADSPENQLAAWLFSKYLLEPEVQAKLVQSLFTLPVRESATELLGEFEDDYPHWAQGAALVESAVALPVSDDWGVAQWVLQDAVNRILQSETDEVTILLEQLDAMITDLAGDSP